MQTEHGEQTFQTGRCGWGGPTPRPRSGPEQAAAASGHSARNLEPLPPCLLLVFVGNGVKRHSQTVAGGLWRERPSLNPGTRPCRPTFHACPHRIGARRRGGRFQLAWNRGSLVCKLAWKLGSGAEVELKVETVLFSFHNATMPCHATKPMRFPLPRPVHPGDLDICDPSRPAPVLRG